MASLAARVAGLALLAVATAGALTAPASAGPSDPSTFSPGVPYSGAFADPTVWRAGSVFYASATNVAGRSLPVTSSTDLRTWTPTAARMAGDPTSNDGLPVAPRWARTRTTPGGNTYVQAWAPSVLRVPGTGYVVAFAAPRRSDGRRCVGLARSARPAGPYRPIGTRPLSCLGGATIDPQLLSWGGRYWLLMKVRDTTTSLVVRRLNNEGTGFARRSGYATLLSAETDWENGIVENPAMIQHAGRLYLFYSANAFWDGRYSTAYAVCKRVTGSCERMGQLLRTDDQVVGPGGATPFFDTAGQLRLAYHVWNADFSARPMRVATLVADPATGLLGVTDLG